MESNQERDRSFVICPICGVEKMDIVDHIKRGHGDVELKRCIVELAEIKSRERDCTEGFKERIEELRSQEKDIKGIIEQAYKSEPMKIWNEVVKLTGEAKLLTEKILYLEERCKYLNLELERLKERNQNSEKEYDTLSKKLEFLKQKEENEKGEKDKSSDSDHSYLNGMLS
jgi:FtsZ-binding cell division protein ZapB